MVPFHPKQNWCKKSKDTKMDPITHPTLTIVITALNIFLSKCWSTIFFNDLTISNSSKHFCMYEFKFHESIVIFKIILY